MGLVLSSLDFEAILPELLLVIGALLLLIKSVSKCHCTAMMFFASAGLLAIAAGLVPLSNSVESRVFFDALMVSPFTQFSKILILLSAAAALLLMQGFYQRYPAHRVPEIPVLVILSVVGMCVMVSAADLLTLYVGLELQSLALYVLAAIHRDDSKSAEAGIKYFVLGALASCILLYGISLIYGFTGTTNFKLLAERLPLGTLMPMGVLVGFVMLAIGLCFKVSAVPFHMWTPDVYEGAPTPMVAFFASAAKIAALVTFLRVAIGPFGGVVVQWQSILIFVSAASMIIGALGGLQQKNIKRLLAYSSIGHVGYMLMGLAAATPNGIRGILLYLSIYSVMTLGVFAFVMLLSRQGKACETIQDLKGLSKTHPLHAMLLLILMFSMAGIPPMAGFMGKFFIFLSALQANLSALALIGVLSSVVAAFYYLRLIKFAYMDEAEEGVCDTIPRGSLLSVCTILAAILNILFILSFAPLLHAAQTAAQALF